jgi:hypothetical protein
MAVVEEVKVVVAHNERATLRVGDVFLKIDADQTRTDVEVEAMALAPIPTPQVPWRKPPVLALQGRVARGNLKHLAGWLRRFDGVDQVAFAVEGCTGWRYVAEEMRKASVEAHLAEPADTAAARGRKRRAKTDRSDARLLRELLAGDRVPECYIPPAHVLEYRALLELYHDLRGGHTGWAQRIQAVFFHQGATRLGHAGVVGAQARARLEHLAAAQLSPVGQLQVATALSVMDTLAGQLHDHEWAKRQAGWAGIGFTELSNGFATCTDSDGLQWLCDQLTPERISRFAHEWLIDLPTPLTDADRTAGFWWDLSMRQVEVSRTIVFNRRQHARVFFEALVADNLDIGRPDHVEIIFGRRLARDKDDDVSHRDRPLHRHGSGQRELQAFPHQAVPQGRPRLSGRDRGQQPERPRCAAPTRTSP